MERPYKRSRCAFVVIKLRMSGADYFLMRRDPDWKDLNFLGGHQQGSEGLQATARRELLEELPALRTFKSFDLAPLTDEIQYGPVFSRSAHCQVEYTLQFYLMTFHDAPTPVLDALGGRTPNILAREKELVTGGTHRISELAKVLDKRLPGGLRSIPSSWSKDLEEAAGSSRMRWNHQTELPLE